MSHWIESYEPQLTAQGYVIEPHDPGATIEVSRNFEPSHALIAWIKPSADENATGAIFACRRCGRSHVNQHAIVAPHCDC